MRTAYHSDLTNATPDLDLLEWDYGRYEGLTAERIRESRPGWDLWRDGVIRASNSRKAPGEQTRCLEVISFGVPAQDDE